jgi:hypothetical protein
MLRLHIGWLRQALCDHTSLIRVAVIPNERGNGMRVVGFSSWVRTVSDPNAVGKVCRRYWRQATWIDGMYCMAEDHPVKILYCLQLEVEIDASVTIHFTSVAYSILWPINGLEGPQI